jgi:hypothetical protein
MSIPSNLRVFHHHDQIGCPILDDQSRSLTLHEAIPRPFPPYVIHPIIAYAGRIWTRVSPSCLAESTSLMCDRLAKNHALASCNVYSY